MTFECIDPCTHPGWATLIDEMPSDVFHSPAWMSVLADTYEFTPIAHLLVDASGTPRAGVPFCRISDLLGDRIVTLPFSDYCDPLVSDQGSWEDLSRSLRGLGRPVLVRCLHSEAPLSDPDFSLSKRAKWHGLDLTPDLDSLWAGFTVTSRQRVRQSERNGIELRWSEDRNDLRAFFGMHLSVRKYKYGLLAQPFAFFENIWRHFVERGQGRLLLAIDHGRIRSAIMLLRWKNTLYYKFSASEPNDAGRRPNEKMMWESIKYGQALGCTRFDFGLSDWDQEGLIQFKRKFGTFEKTISFLQHVPDGVVAPYESEARRLLAGMTRVFVDRQVPDLVTERAGADLYRFFV